MPKVQSRQTAAEKFASKLNGTEKRIERSSYIVPKSNTEREQLVMKIWNSLAKPNRKFKTQEEQIAYWAGVNEERELQRTYDHLLRDHGLR